MVDVVANHVGPVDLSFSSINPFNSSNDYHSKCEITGSNPPKNMRLVNIFFSFKYFIMKNNRIAD